MSFCEAHPTSKSYKNDNSGPVCRGCVDERRNKKLLVISEMLGDKCAICGSSEALEVDHIDPTTKNQKLLKRKSDFKWQSITSLGTEDFNRELRLCQRLCHDCHCKKTTKENYPMPEHGTPQRYWRGCRCDDCYFAQSDYRRALYQKTGR